MSHLITYQSGNSKSQIDYILVRKRDLKSVKDVKVIPGEECTPQHKLLVCDLELKFDKPRPKQFIPKRCVWKLRDPTVQATYSDVVSGLLVNDGNTANGTEEIWIHLKENLLKATEEVCGWTKKKNLRKESWWWDDSVSEAVTKKRRLWKAWKNGGCKEEYLLAKRASKRAVYTAKKTAEEARFSKVKDGSEDIFKIAKQMKRSNLDVVGEKCVLDDSGNLCLDTESKKKAWKEHYNRLLNEEFPWDQNSLSHVDPVAGPATCVSGYGS